MERMKALKKKSLLLAKPKKEVKTITPKKPLAEETTPKKTTAKKTTAKKD